MGKPAILVPYPYAADDHQRKNAEAWQRAGAAEVLLDQELSPSRLEELVVRLARDARLRQKMADNARSLARPQAAEEVARVCEEVGRKA
jgi:UDP-N-acetylglucosamine--N-acetylmuramyl-(pentapeptide) pyrophosphoryl-undecaprenol N-acetylglucosamine transferase